MNSKMLIPKDEAYALKRARRITQSAIHPDLKEPIPVPLRMSMFAFMNTPILFGLIMSKPTMLNVAFWQWTNQSYNAGLNFANRSASSEFSKQDLIKSYILASTSSIGIGMILNKAFQPVTNRLSGTKKLFVSTFCGFSAVFFASAANLFFMRGKEIKEGITVFDEEKHELGKS